MGSGDEVTFRLARRIVTVRERALAYAGPAVLVGVLALVMRESFVLLGMLIIGLRIEIGLLLRFRGLDVTLSNVDLRVPSEATHPIWRLALTKRKNYVHTVVDLTTVRTMHRDAASVRIDYHDSKSREPKSVVLTLLRPEEFAAELGTRVRRVQGIAEPAAAGAQPDTDARRFDLAPQITARRRLMAYAIAVTSGGILGWVFWNLPGVGIGLLAGIVAGEILSRLSLGDIPSVQLTSDGIGLPDGFRDPSGTRIASLPYSSIGEIREAGRTVEVAYGSREPLALTLVDPGAFVAELKRRTGWRASAAP